MSRVEDIFKDTKLTEMIGASKLNDLLKKEEEVEQLQEKLNSQHELMIQELEKVSQLSKEEAKRLAQKYVSLVEKVFDETDNIWEKYNVVEGNINVSNEYKMPAMMGWSAGTYLAAAEYLNK